MDSALGQRYLRKSQFHKEHAARTEFRDDATPEQKQGPFLLCKQCRNRITNIDHMIAVHGAHRHSFINPAGYPYDIACFSDAPGCTTDRISTFEHTWFEGYCWSLAVCSYCAVHIGWFYHSDNDHFFGLIIERLIDDNTYH